MVLLLHLVGYAAAGAALLFVTLSLASGLLWLSEIIEEHSRTSKVVGIRAIYAVIALHVLLWLFDSLPFTRIVFSILCHLVYLTNFTPQWPMISLTSYSFIGSCLLVLADHFIWFTYFSQRTHNARQSMRRFGSTEWRPVTGSEAHMLTFMDIATFFGICVWLIPLFLFLSLSANDNALPMSLNDPGTPGIHTPSLDASTSTPLSASYFERIQSSSPINLSTSSRPHTLIQKIAHPILSFLPRLGRGHKGRDDTDGLIAPARTKTPVGSPLPSPRSSPPREGGSPWGPPASPGRSPRHGELNGLGVSVGYGRPPVPPFLQPPPIRRATTDGASSASSFISRRTKSPLLNGNGHGFEEEGGGETMSVPTFKLSINSPPRDGFSNSGRRRVASGDDVFID